MKKVLKITLITLATFLVVIIIAVSILLWIVFTPSRLTPIVQKQVTQRLTCQSKIGDVELTFFSTFPQFSLKMAGLTLINPIEGAPSDTLLQAANVTAAIDMRALWKNDEIIMEGIELDQISGNIFVNKAGVANYNVYKSNTTDTSSFKNPFKRIDIHKIIIKNSNISYINQVSDMSAKLANLNGELDFDMADNKVNALLNASAKEVSYRRDSVVYVKNIAIELNMPFGYDVNTGLLTLKNTKLIYNDLAAELYGTVQNSQTNDDMKIDLQFRTDSYGVKPLLTLIPEKYQKKMKDMEMTGMVISKGSVIGVYNDSLMPVFKVNAQLDKGTFQYVSLPYKLREMVGNADVLVDMNNERASLIIINDLKTKTGESAIQGKGIVKYILADDMSFDMDMNMQLNLPELDPMMPDGMNIKLGGRASGSGNLKFMLSDAMNHAYDKMKISGNFDATNLSVKYDSLTMDAPVAKLNLNMPNNLQNKNAKFMRVGLWGNKLNVHKGNSTAATIYNSNMLMETSNIMHTDKLNAINCDFSFDSMSASMDNMFTNMGNSKGKLETWMNFHDSITTPKVNCDFDIQSLTASMDSMGLKASYPKGTFAMQDNPNHPGQAEFSVDVTSGSTTANMGAKMITASHFSTKTKVEHNDKEKNTMLKWIPTGSVAMTDGKVTIPDVKANIKIPTIQFNYTSDEYEIKDSRMIIDNSDFQLAGKLWNVSKYLHNEGLLKGDFNFNSKKTDVYRLMALTNSFGEQDTIPEGGKITQTEKTSTGPYMVPKGVDVTLHTKVDLALLGFDSIRDVTGDLYIKDGLLALQDMQFVSTAARMQLTAMYRTPRKNHLFVGLDFHMMDVEISELLNMIPNIDSIMPMLRSFDGKGEFHMAVETYLDSLYNPKKSTLRGVASIKGENLVLMDGQTFTKIAKLLLFNKKTRNKIDSMSVEFTIFKNEIDVYPFLLVMDKYKAVVGGRHNTDLSFDYHISVTDSPLPFHFGVHVNGTMDHLKIGLEKSKYGNMYRPVDRKEIDIKRLEIRKMIRDALTKEVK